MKNALYQDHRDSEEHLFIVWHHAKSFFSKIIDDIKKRFLILNVIEIEWNDASYLQNLIAFYAHSQFHLGTDEIIALMKYKQDYIGVGSFYAILVRDASPIYSLRQTSSGEKNVNSNVFDAKDLYRQWTGGGHLIHATNSVREFVNDTSLLFGSDFEPDAEAWTGEIRKISRDVVGAGGWKSIEELFFILNSSLNYIVLRNFEPLPANYYFNEHGDIDLLVENLNLARYLTHAQAVFNEPHRVHFKIKINDADVFFDFRYVGDRYYDEKWERELLLTKKLENGIFRPDAEHYFYSLLYHALVHKNAVTPDYKEKLIKLGQTIKIKLSMSDFDHNLPGMLLTNFMNQNEYQYVNPNDLSVTYNKKYIQAFIHRSIIYKSIPFKLIHPKEMLISSRCIANMDGVNVWSCVYDDGTKIYKQATFDLAQREAHFLNALISVYFPRVIDCWSEDDYSVIVLEKIIGEPLEAVIGTIIESPSRMFSFIEDCLNILGELESKGITHRDLHAANILVRDGRPVLIDFGWAVSDDFQIYTPDSLGSTGRPSDGSFCDAYSIGKVLEQVNGGRYIQFSNVIRLMIESDSQLRMTDLSVLKSLFSLAYKQELQSEKNQQKTIGEYLLSEEVVIAQLLNLILRQNEQLELYKNENRDYFQQILDKEQAMQALLAQAVEEEPVTQTFLTQAMEKEQAMQALLTQMAEKEQGMRTLLAKTLEKERLSAQLLNQSNQKKALIQRELKDLTNSKAWKLVLMLRKIRCWIIPIKSRREKIARHLYNAIRSNRADKH